MGLGHKKQADVLRDKILRRYLQKRNYLQKRIARRDLKADSREERIIAQANQIGANYFSMSGEKGYQAPNQWIETQQGRYYKERSRSKYGVAVIEASKTELGQNPNDSALDFTAPEDMLVMSFLDEQLEAPHNVTEEELLEQMGMHVLDLEEDDSEDLEYLE